MRRDKTIEMRQDEIIAFFWRPNSLMTAGLDHGNILWSILWHFTCLGNFHQTVGMRVARPTSSGGLTCMKMGNFTLSNLRVLIKEKISQLKSEANCYIHVHVYTELSPQSKGISFKGNFQRNENASAFTHLLCRIFHPFAQMTSISGVTWRHHVTLWHHMMSWHRPTFCIWPSKAEQVSKIAPKSYFPTWWSWALTYDLDHQLHPKYCKKYIPEPNFVSVYQIVQLLEHGQADRRTYKWAISILYHGWRVFVTPDTWSTLFVCDTTHLPPNKLFTAMADCQPVRVKNSDLLPSLGWKLGLVLTKLLLTMW